MPFDWVDAEVFLEHNGVTIYHVYKNDFMNGGSRTYHYGTSPDCSDDGDEHGEFDVRELPGAHVFDLNNYDGIKAAIVAAIDAGHIVAPKEDG